MANEKAIAQTTTTTFRMEHSVRRTIRASVDRVWSLLTDAPRFPSWNSTVTRIEGPIALGTKLAIEVPAAPGRVFKPKVTALVDKESMVWSEGMAPMFKGVREFTVREVSTGVTEFTMREELSGLMLPMVRSSLPSFGPIFETYAEDLARAAESGARA